MNLRAHSVFYQLITRGKVSRVWSLLLTCI